MRELRFIKVKRRLVRWLSIATKNTLAPFFERGGILELLAYPIFLWLVFLAHGFRAMSEEAFISWAAVQALIYAVPAFIFVNLITAAFRVMPEEAKEGIWSGRTFVYNQPKHVFTTVVKFEDNGKMIPFTVSDVEPNSFVNFSIQNSNYKVAAQICSKMAPIILDWNHISHRTNFGARIGKDRKAILVTESVAGADPTAIRVFVTSWGADDGPR